jgi:uncharacterized membrane protein YheB (UPF0754 family)
MKTVTLSLGKALDLDAELNGVKNQQTGEQLVEGLLFQELPLVIKYHLEKVVKQTAEQKTLVDKLREDLIKKYGTQDGENFSIPLYTNEVKDEDGKLISADINPAYVTFNNEFIKLLEQSVDIKIKEFTIEDFKDIKSKDYPKVLLSLLDDEA